MEFKNVCAIIPCYGQDGANGCIIIFNDGHRTFYDYPAKRYMHAMITNHHLDPRTLSSWSQQFLGGKVNLPIILNRDLVFIPIKMRSSIGKHDGCFGYISTSYIHSIYKNKITLINNTTISTRSSITYVQEKQRDARLLHYLYCQYKAEHEFMRYSLAA